MLWEAARKEPISHWLMLWSNSRIWEARKEIGLAQPRWSSSYIPTTFSSGLLTTWRAAERFYVEGFGFLFDNTLLCCPCVCISLPLSLPFIFCCGCDFNWLRLFINSIYSLCSFSAHFVFIIKLELVILFLGV